MSTADTSFPKKLPQKLDRLIRHSSIHSRCDIHRERTVNVSKTVIVQIEHSDKEHFINGFTHIAHHKMVVNFAGKYKLSKSENFDEYMKAMGVGLAMRKMAGLMSPSCEVTQNGDNFEIKMNVPMVNTHIQKFKIGEPFQDLAPTGDKTMVIVSWDGDKLVFDEVEKTDPPHQIIRELNGDDMVVKCIKGDAVCRRVFRRT